LHLDIAPRTLNRHTAARERVVQPNQPEADKEREEDKCATANEK
jgi:hypothetical protein